MIFLTRLGFVLVLTLSLCLAPLAQGDDSITVRVDQLFAEWDKPDSPGCAVAVVRDGYVIHTRGYGLANLEYGVPIAPSTIFHIASISKQFTAMAACMLADEGRLSLDDDVRKYLPELPDFGRIITLRHLLYHTSGLRDQWNLLILGGWRMEDVITEKDIYRLICRQRELNFDPGAEHLYCNTGYTLLAMVVQRVSGRSLREYAQSNIFEPLGMKRTHFHDDHKQIVKDRAYSYSPGKGGFQHSHLQYATVGATSLFTTVEDLAQWDLNFDNPRVGGRRVIDEMLRKGTLNSGKAIDYAAGLAIGSYRGLRTVGHGGADAGFRSMYLRFPDQRFSVIVFSNLGSFNVDGMAKKVADIYLADELQKDVAAVPQTRPNTKPTEARIDPRAFDACVGDYQLFPGFLVTFTREGNRFFVQATNQSRDEIFPVSETEYFLKVADIRLTFQKTNGQVEQVIIHQNGQQTPARRVTRPNLSPGQLAEYIGDYYSPELSVTYTVLNREGKLYLRHCKGEDLLTVTAPDEFAAGLGGVKFTREASRINELAISNGRVRNLRFVRVELPTLSSPSK